MVDRDSTHVNSMRRRGRKPGMGSLSFAAMALSVGVAATLAAAWLREPVHDLLVALVAQETPPQPAGMRQPDAQPMPLN